MKLMKLIIDEANNNKKRAIKIEIREEFMVVKLTYRRRGLTANKTTEVNR